MKIVISAQHLNGNDPEEFNAAAWLEALESEYRTIAVSYFPGAEVQIRIDQQNACGYTRQVAVDFEDDEDADAKQQQGMIFQIEQAANALYDARGNEFFA